MAKFKVELDDIDSVSLYSNESNNGTPKEFSLGVCGYSPSSCKSEVINVLLDRYQLHEIILKMDMMLRNQVK